MKKIILMVAAVAAMVSLTNCTKDNNGDNGGGEDTTTKYRITQYSAVWEAGKPGADVHDYAYNEAGKVVSVTRAEDRKWDFTYGENIVIARSNWSDGAWGTPYTVYTLTLGTNGYVSKMVAVEDEEEYTYTYTYNEAGYMTEVKAGDTVAAILVYEDNCCTSWSEETYNDGAGRKKIQTFLAKPNTAGIFTVYAEKGTGLSRWLMETGLFGKPSAYMCESTVWETALDKKANYTYTYSTENEELPVAEYKDYPGWPEEFLFVHELVK